MPRRPQTSSSATPPDDAGSLFADLLDDEAGGSDAEADGEADGEANGERAEKVDAKGIPPAIAYLPADAVTAPETALGDPDLPYWLALNRVKGIGPARFRLLLESFGSARGAWEAYPADWQAAGLDAVALAGDVRDEDRGLLDFAGAAVDRRHAETDPLPALEATRQDAVIRVRWIDEDRRVAPDDQLS